MFETVWRCLEVFGGICMCLEVSGCVWGVFVGVSCRDVPGSAGARAAARAARPATARSPRSPPAAPRLYHAVPRPYHDRTTIVSRTYHVRSARIASHNAVKRLIYHTIFLSLF